jgi:molybdate transport system regulatory protein
VELKVKIWLRGDEEHGFLGEGRYRLLRAIAGEGSLQQAARSLGMSYRKAWGDVRAMEEQLGFELVEKQRGGAGGGTSTLTERAQQLLDAFAEIKHELETEGNTLYDKKLKPLLTDMSRKH